MSRYLVAVGGSGQHAALAIADYLVLAEGVVETPLPPIHFFLLDGDPSATKTDQPSAWDLCLEQLQAIHRADPSRGMPQTRHDPPYPDLPVGVETARQALEAMLGPDAPDLLLSEDEGRVLVRHGYFGKPHVAGILTEILLRRVENKKVEEQHVVRQLIGALETDARICLVGSTVGGTGAGVLPRLVEYLASKNTRAKICANVGLEWFQIAQDQQQGAARQVQMPSNATASLWHYVRERTTGKYRLVLWGHPNIGHATQEDDRGDRFQPVKKNLTLPFHAAAAAIAFLNADETQTREVSPVVPEKRVGLPRSLDLGHHDLHWLIERNRDLLGRWAHLKNYIDHPYTGAVVPWLRDQCRVVTVDAKTGSEKKVLVEAIETLTRAKLAALARLTESDSTLAIGKPIERQGIATLRSWLSREVSLSAITAGLSKVESTAAEDSAVRLIREEAMARQAFTQAREGTRQPLETGHIDAVAAFERVEAERVPDLRATERVLAQFFVHAKRDVLANRSTLLDNFGELLLPQALLTTDGDRVEQWVRRWLFLLHATVAGAARPHELGRAIEGITHGIYIGNAPQPIGYLSPSLSVVPNFAAFWSNDTEMQAVRSRAGSVSTLAGWVRIVEAAAACNGGIALPPWMAWLARILQNVNSRTRMRASATSISVDMDQVRQIPVQAETGEKSLVEAVCTALSVPIQSLQAADRDFSDEERRIWEDLNSRRVPYRFIDLRTSEGWVTMTEDAEIVWSDLLTPHTKRYKLDDVVLYPGRAYGWRRRTMAQFITPADVILNEVAVLVGADGHRTATTPVRGQYSNLVTSASSAVAPDGSVHVDITLAGRPEPITRHYSSADVIEFLRLTIFSWPAMSSIGNASQSLLITDNSDVRYRLRVIYANQRDVVLSPILTDTNTVQYLTPASNGVTADMRPVALSVQAQLPGTTEWIDLGVLTYRRESAPDVAGMETWAIDFGTSSTVVVRGTPGITPLIVRPTVEGDATSVYACGGSIPRSGLHWYSTWDGVRPSETQSGVVPSQIIHKARQREEDRSISELIFGRDFMIDHGEEFDGAQAKYVEGNLKWRDEVKLRTDYLTHLLEQAVIMEIARSKRRGQNFPGEVRMVFTLPLRQRAGVDGFAQEIARVTAALQQRTGVMVSPRFQWESLAVAPPETGSERMIVVADLGGGTLDMYARYRKDTEIREGADSARIGGRYCFALLETKIGENLNARRWFLRHGNPAAREEVANREPRVRLYFELIQRYIVLWTAALRKKWNVPEEVVTDVQLAGMTWSLPGAPSSQASVADLLKREAQRQKLKIMFAPYAADLSIGGSEERKIFLARSAAGFDSYDPVSLISKARSLTAVLGLPAKGGGMTFDESCTPAEVHPSDRRLELELSDARRLYPDASDVLLSNLTYRLSQPMDPRGLGPGGYDSRDDCFGLSPLTLLAELAVEHLIPEATDGRRA